MKKESKYVCDAQCSVCACVHAVHVLMDYVVSCLYTYSSNLEPRGQRVPCLVVYSSSSKCS